MQSAVININGRDVELFFSTRAMINISERCGGDIANIGEWLEDENICKTITNVAVILSDLANGAIIKHNADIALGLEDGQKRQLYPEQYFVDVLNPAEISEYKIKIFEALGLGSTFEIPEGIVIEEKDADLEEIEAEKEKNAAGA